MQLSPSTGQHPKVGIHFEMEAIIRFEEEANQRAYTVHVEIEIVYKVRILKWKPLKVINLKCLPIKWIR